MIRVSPGLTFNLKLPSMSVTVPILLAPFTFTDAPMIGSPVLSVTVPPMPLVWAYAPEPASMSILTKATFAFFIRYTFYVLV